MMDHIVEESKKVYANTEFADTFLIYHDALSAYFEKEAQEHMEHLGFKDRQVRCISANNERAPRL